MDEQFLVLLKATLDKSGIPAEIDEIRKMVQKAGINIEMDINTSDLNGKTKAALKILTDSLNKKYKLNIDINDFEKDFLDSFKSIDNIASKQGSNVGKNLAKGIDTGVKQGTKSAVDTAKEGAKQIADVLNKSIDGNSNLSNSKQQEDLRKEIAETEKYIEREKQKLESLNNIINNNVDFKGKKEASDGLRYWYKRITEAQSDGNASDQLVVTYNNVYRAAEKLGVAQSTLNKYYEPISINNYEKSLERVKGSYDVTRQSIEFFTKQIDELNQKLGQSFKSSNETPVSSEGQKSNIDAQTESINAQNTALEENVRLKQEEKGVNETNLSSEVTKPENLENAVHQLDDLAQKKKEVADANKELFETTEPSEEGLAKEGQAASNIIKDMTQLAEAKLKAAEANEKLKQTADETAPSLQNEGEAAKNTRKNVNAVDPEVYSANYLDWQKNIKEGLSSDNGGQFLDVVGAKINQLESGLVKFTATVQTADGEWHKFSATVNSSGNIIKESLGDLKANELERLLNAIETGADTSKFFNLEQIEDFANQAKAAIQDIKGLTDTYNVSVSDSGVLSITKTFKDASGEVKTFKAEFADVEEFIQKASGDAQDFANYFNQGFERATVNAGQVQQRVSQVAQSVSNATQSFSKLENLKFTIEGLDSTDKEAESLQNRLRELIKNMQQGGQSKQTEQWKHDFNELAKDTKSYIDLISTALPQKIDALKKRISNLLLSNPKWSAASQIQAKDFLQELSASAGPTNARLQEIARSIDQIAISEREAGRSGKTWMDGLKQRFASLTQYLASFASFYKVIDIFKQAIGTVRDLDTALAEMRKVSDESLSSLKNFQDQSFDLAKTVGVTALQIQQSTADFMRLGKSLDEAKDYALAANELMQVSEFNNIEDATQSLISMSQAWQDVDVEHINDVLNKLGNETSISTDELARSLQISAGTLATLGSTLEEASALTVAANSIIQDESKVAGGLRTIQLRLVGTETAKNELKELGEDIDDFVVSTNSKMQKQIKELTAVASNNFKGFDILDENGNYKDFYDIMLGLSKIYKEIQEQDKKLGNNAATALIELIAGKNRSSIAGALLSNPELLSSAYEKAMNAEGSAAEELEKQLDTIEADSCLYVQKCA